MEEGLGVDPRIRCGNGTGFSSSRGTPNAEGQSGRLQEGVKPGQRVLAVSHPVERDQMWELQPGALITRVKDIFRVTRSPEVP